VRRDESRSQRLFDTLVTHVVQRSQRVYIYPWELEINLDECLVFWGGQASTSDRFRGRERERERERDGSSPAVRERAKAAVHPKVQDTIAICPPVASQRPCTRRPCVVQSVTRSQPSHVTRWCNAVMYARRTTYILHWIDVRSTFRQGCHLIEYPEKWLHISAYLSNCDSRLAICMIYAGCASYDLLCAVRPSVHMDGRNLSL
jgi:hypothetical protein